MATIYFILAIGRPTTMRAVVALALATAVQALDISTVENVLAGLGDTSCRLELMALGMSFINAHSCVTTSNSWDDVNRCNDKVFDFLVTGGQILEKPKCADPLAQIINKHIVNIDMKPIFQILEDLYECSESETDISKCRDDAVPALLKVGGQFFKELMEGTSPEFNKLTVDTFESETAFGRCLAAAPTLKSQLPEGEYAQIKERAQDFLDAINKFGSSPLKRLLDDKQDWALERVVEALNDKTPLSSSMRGLKADDLVDMRKCEAEWKAYSDYMAKLLRSDDLHMMHMRLFDRVPLLNPLRPWYQAFFDNVDGFLTDVLPQTQCLVQWTKSDELNTCITNLGHTLQTFVDKVVAAEKMEYEQDIKEGWNEDSTAHTTRVPTPTTTSFTSVYAPTIAFTPAPTTMTSATVAITSVVPPLSPPNSPHQSNWVATLLHALLGLVCTAGLVSAVMYLRTRTDLMNRWRGFRPLPTRDEDAMDNEAQRLLRELDDDSDSEDEDMINL